MRVYVTGANGLVGRSILNHLREQGIYAVGCDVNPVASERLVGEDLPGGDDHAPRSLPARSTLHADGIDEIDVREEEKLLAALKKHEITAVVHCAADPRGDAPFEIILQSNVIGTKSVVKCCVESGTVKRLVYFSSLMVMWGYWMNEPPYCLIRQGQWDQVSLPLPLLTLNSPVRATTDYAASKMWGESLCRAASENHGLSVMCVRLGAVNAQDDPLDASWSTLLCTRKDVSELVAHCLIAPESVKYEIFFCVSNSPHRWVDVSRAKEVVGWEPKDRPVYEPPERKL